MEFILNSVQKQIDTLNTLKESISGNYHEFVKLLNILETKDYSKRIILSGVGKNAALAAKSSETYASLGIPSMFLNICHYTHGDAGFIGPNDILVHISKSGKTLEMINAASHLRANRPNIKQILLSCDSTNNPELFDLAFNIGDIVEADTLGLAPTSSSTGLLVLLDTIGIILSNKLDYTKEDFHSFHPGGSLGNLLKDSLK